MELAYLFIKGRVKGNVPGYENIENTPYKVFKDSEFCFCNEYQITYNDSTGLMSLTENKEFVPNFFDKAGKVKSVTSLVGMNGTGKSSVLECIKAITSSNFDEFPYKFIAIFRVEKSYNLIKSSDFFIVRHDDLKFNLDSKNHLPKNCTIGNVILLSQISSRAEKIPSFRIIYLSNILEVFSTRFSGYKNGDKTLIDDISSTGLLNNDVEIKLNKSANFSFEDCYHGFRLMECKRQLDFLLKKDEFKFIEFDFPTFVEIQPNLFYESEIKQMLKTQGSDFISELFNQVGKQINSLKGKYAFNLHKSIYYYLVRYCALEAPGYPADIYTISNSAFEGNNVSNDRIKKLIQTLISSLEKFGLEDDVIKYKKILKILDYVDLLSESDFIYGSNMEPSLVLNLNENQDFLKDYNESLFLTGYLNLDWRFTKYSLGDLSSGEKAMLSIFSRLYSLQKDYVKFKNSYETKNLIILIDEGDQLLHPEWQREFLSCLFNSLPQLFPESSSIQIVLTSHSPFITSDLPRYCVMYLEKNSEGVTKVVEGKEKAHTLGANIHQLYRDSFYMPNSMMGEFARTKINDIIEELKSLDKFNSQEQKNHFLKRAELIGERFLSAKIKDLINSKQEGKNDSN